MAYLEGKGVELQKHDLIDQPLEKLTRRFRRWRRLRRRRDRLRHTERRRHLEDFLNTRSPSFKERNDPKRAVFGFDADKYDRLTKP